MTPKAYPYDSYESLSIKSDTSIPKTSKSGETFWMVVRLGSGGYTKADAHPAKEHSTYEEACAEAERLSAKHPTHARGFAVLQAKRIVRAEIALTTTFLT